ncbi:MAG TPA: amidohydrolase family protein [Pseudobdellovibrionaceae bacterium]|nr:amidohydrolase family protein [Pseudobdellovibrionaceae bacterium]
MIQTTQAVQTTQTIENLFDSHVHFRMTGEIQSRLDLSKLKSSEELKTLHISPSHFLGDWIVGFGWDEYLWPEKDQNLNKTFLDKIFPHQPVLFSRKDGHRAWVNSLALTLNPEIESLDSCLKDSKGESVGILLENAHYALLRNLPRPSKNQIEEHLLRAQSLFHQAGFTHVRDLSTSMEQEMILRELNQNNKLKLFIKSNLVCDRFSELDSTLEKAQVLKSEESNRIQFEGLKLFYDGSLGSETALLSKSYPLSSSTMQNWDKVDKNFGQRLWEPKELENAIEKIWKRGLDVSIHVIGDQAVDEVVDCARRVSANGIVGRLNLEHVQILRPETLQKMKNLHVRCHLQPCHFLSDRVWLKEKLGDLFSYAFPWEALRRAKIPFYFGSDSPIEPTSVFNNLRALNESAEAGIPQLQTEGGLGVFQFHQAYDLWENLGSNKGIKIQNSKEQKTFTVLDVENHKIKEVWFQGEQLL